MITYNLRLSLAVLMMALSLGLSGCSSKTTPPSELIQHSGIQNGQFVFNSPEDALAALDVAVATQDRALLYKLFGPGSLDLFFTGDRAADKRELESFSSELSARSQLVSLPSYQSTESPNHKQELVALFVGDSNSPFPVPLIGEDGLWRFDTASGRRELRTRKIGENELNALEICSQYVVAQRSYFDHTAAAAAQAGAKTPKGEYAQKFFSSPGKSDGLYWDSSSAGKVPSPLSKLFAQALDSNSLAPGRPPYHGYYFKILTSQGPAARGGAMNYIKGGKMVNGFALIAYPATWDHSGAATFLVGPDGVIYEKNLGSKTAEIAKTTGTFNPDPSWRPILLN